MKEKQCNWWEIAQSLLLNLDPAATTDQPMFLGRLLCGSRVSFLICAIRTKIEPTS